MNKMGVPNIAMIFGPTLMSNEIVSIHFFLWAQKARNCLTSNALVLNFYACNWSKNLAPFSQPISSKSTINMTCSRAFYRALLAEGRLHPLVSRSDWLVVLSQLYFLITLCSLFFFFNRIFIVAIFFRLVKWMTPQSTRNSPLLEI